VPVKLPLSYKHQIIVINKWQDHHVGPRVSPRSHAYPRKQTVLVLAWSPHKSFEPTSAHLHLPSCPLAYVPLQCQSPIDLSIGGEVGGEWSLKWPKVDRYLHRLCCCGRLRLGTKAQLGRSVGIRMDVHELHLSIDTFLYSSNCWVSKT
jgi:hypothetical protein